MFDKSLALALTAWLVFGCGDGDASPRTVEVAARPAGSEQPAAAAPAGMAPRVASPTAMGATGMDGVPSGGLVNGIGSGGTEGNAPAVAGSGGSGAEAVAGMEWLPSWATSIQRTEPNNLPPALANNTLRQFLWPTVPGETIRIQLSNEKGTTPVEIQKVHIALALTQGTSGNSMGQIDAATEASFSFNGAASATIAPGQTLWSDALEYSLPEIRLATVSMQFGTAVPVEITGHPGARETSYIVSGDAVSEQALAGAETRDRWYFINALEVMARSDAYAIAALGDSITDGYGVLNQFARWPDFMTLAIQNDPTIADNRSVLNFGMGANLLTSTGMYQDAGVLRFERDVLTRDKIKWLIVFEGINDINGGVQAPTIIDAYRQIIAKAHEKGILVYGSPITPNGANAVRTEVNDWIRTSGEFDQVIDFDAVIRDPGNQDNILQMYNNDNLHPSIAGYEAMGNAVDLSLFHELMQN